jgi:Fe-S-cluster containining protein
MLGARLTRAARPRAGRTRRRIYSEVAAPEGGVAVVYWVVMIDRRALVDNLIEYTCGQRCMGQPGNKGGCCTLGDRDFIIGPMPDVDEFLVRLAARLGRPVARWEVFIDYEEGKALFPERSCWQNPRNYPALRIDTMQAKLPCRFYDAAGGRCSVYEIRPNVCRTYMCGPLKQLVSLV